MSLHWYACISTNTYCFETHYISLETDWWALPNASSIVWICSAVHEILADDAFTATDGLISQSFAITFVYPIYVWIALIWGFPVQLSLWKSVHWLWRYKLNEVCNTIPICFVLAQWEQSPTMLPLESIGCDFFQTWTFCVHVTTIPSSQGDIFFMSVRDSMGIGTWEETR